ncbi:MAG TPA: hypothetical protein VD969_04115 [Symbiobacteriaceae bacterium]|nr:hypothetical protein [Symbiobacteriaceae bacterium]
MSVTIRLILAVALPVLLYFSTVNLPLGDSSWLGFLNNFLWIATAIYFVLYLPIRGLGLKHWMARILVALLAVSILTTAFQGAVKVRRDQYKAPKAGETFPGFHC